MVKMEKRPEAKRPPNGSIARYYFAGQAVSLAGKDLPGFRSHVRYSVFKDRRHVKRPPRCEKRTGNLASAVGVVNRVVLRGRLCSCSEGQYRRGALPCQIRLLGGRCALQHNDLSAFRAPDRRRPLVRTVTRKRSGRPRILPPSRPIRGARIRPATTRAGDRGPRGAA